MERERIGVKPGINILPTPEPKADITPKMRREHNEDWFVMRFEEYLKLPQSHMIDKFRRADFLYYTVKKHVEYLKSKGFGG